MITIANTAFTVTDTVELARSTTDPITAPRTGEELFHGRLPVKRGRKLCQLRGVDAVAAQQRHPVGPVLPYEYGDAPDRRGQLWDRQHAQQEYQHCDTEHRQCQAQCIDRFFLHLREMGREPPRNTKHRNAQHEREQKARDHRRQNTCQNAEKLATSFRLVSAAKSATPKKIRSICCLSCLFMGHLSNQRSLHLFTGVRPLCDAQLLDAVMIYFDNKHIKIIVSKAVARSPARRRSAPSPIR